MKKYCLKEDIRLKLPVRYSDDKSYTKKRLQQNIRNAKSIDNSIVTDSDITQPIYIPWINNGWKEINKIINSI